MIKILIFLALHSFGCVFENHNKEANSLSSEGEIRSEETQKTKEVDSSNLTKIILNPADTKETKEITKADPKNKKERTDKSKLLEKTDKADLKKKEDQTNNASINPGSELPTQIKSSEEKTSKVEPSVENNEKRKPEVNQEKEVFNEDVSSEIDHSQFDELLKKHVRNGKVNYSGLKKDINLLDEYLEIIKVNRPKENNSRNERLAYWINAYNAFTIKLILENYPLKSITDLHGGKPWDVKWIEIGNKKMSLNNIENDIIRPKFNEPRIHFAVNCAAKSCPPLASVAFNAINLNSLLEERTSKFINDPMFNSISKSKIEISKIFDWYGQDFGDLVSFIDKYSAENISNNAQVAYKEYDWSLNN